MASITISDLSSMGADLFQDSESFLNDLTDHEMVNLFGGWNKLLWTAYCNNNDGGGEFLYSVYQWG
jgi:hypothetical protein